MRSSILNKKLNKLIEQNKKLSGKPRSHSKTDQLGGISDAMKKFTEDLKSKVSVVYYLDTLDNKENNQSMEELISYNKSLRSKNIELQHKLDSIKEEKKKLKDEAHFSEESNKLNMADVKRLKDQNTAFVSKFAKIENELREASESAKTLGLLKKQHEQQIRDLKDENNKLEARAEKAESKNREYRAKLTCKSEMYIEVTNSLKSL